MSIRNGYYRLISWLILGEIRTRRDTLPELWWDDGEGHDLMSEGASDYVVRECVDGDDLLNPVHRTCKT